MKKITKKFPKSREKCCRTWENVAKFGLKQPKNDPKNIILPCLKLDKIHFVKVFDKWEFARDFAVFAIFRYLPAISLFPVDLQYRKNRYCLLAVCFQEYKIDP